MALALLDLWDNDTLPATRPQSGMTTTKQKPMEIVVTAPKKLEAMPAEWRAKAIQKRDFCRDVIEYQIAYRCAQKIAVTALAATQAERYPELAKRGQLNFPNLRNWLSKIKRGKGQYDWNDVEALADDYGWGKVSGPKGDPDFWTVFWALYLNQRNLSVRKCWRDASAWTRKHNAFAALPKITQVTYQVSNADKRMIYSSRRGNTWAENHMFTFIDRDWSRVKPGQVWVADHRVFDFWVKTWDEKLQLWVPRRMWICAFVDAKSWHLIAARIEVEAPNNAIIRRTLIDGIRAFGLPEAIYCDNGKDFLAQGFAEPVRFADGENNPKIYSHAILDALNIRVIKSLPYRGRAKIVERWFGNVSSAFDRKFGSYLGNVPAARPEAVALYSKSQAMIQRLMSEQQACERFDAWLKEYHNMPGEGKILAGMTPAEALNAQERFSRAPISDEQLFYAMLKPLAQLHKIGRGPSVSFGKREYRAAECDEDAIWKYFEKKVMIKVDAFNPDHVFGYTIDGRLIGEFVAKPQIDAIHGNVRDEMRRQYLQGRTAKQLVWAHTGGFHNLAPWRITDMTADELAHPERLRIVDGVKSVRGPSHQFNHYELPGDAPETALPAPVVTPDMRITPGEEKDREMARIGVLLQPRKNDDEVSSEDIARAHNIIVKIKGGDDDEF